MTKLSTRLSKLNSKQRRLFDFMYKNAQYEGIADKEEVYKRVLSLSEAEIDRTLSSFSERVDDASGDSIMRRIKAMYSEEQLRRLADGQGIERANKLDLPKTTHHRIGVMSDSHIGSLYSPDDWMPGSIAKMQEAGCECILHCGDLVEGMKAARLREQIHEIKPTAIGYRKMRDSAISALAGLTIPLYIISGNHDKFFQDDCNIVEDVCEKVPMAHYLGHDKTFFEIGGVKMALFHGGDAYSNVRINRVAEKGVGVVQNDVKMLFAGHVHKFEIRSILGCMCVHVPCLQAQSQWMSGKCLQADTGYLIVDFDACNGVLKNITIQYNIL